MNHFERFSKLVNERIISRPNVFNEFSPEIQEMIKRCTTDKAFFVELSSAMELLLAIYPPLLENHMEAIALALEMGIPKLAEDSSEDS